MSYSTRPISPSLSLPLKMRRPRGTVILSLTGIMSLALCFSYSRLHESSQTSQIRGEHVPIARAIVPSPMTPSQAQLTQESLVPHWRRNLTRFSHPTDRFRDNLWPDKQYVTSWGNAGFTNDFMAYINLIYLGVLTDRIPIIPAFSPSHHVPGNHPLYFGDVFDIPALSDTLRHPILEWPEVKVEGSEELETLGGWAPWWTTGVDGHARDSSSPKTLKIDISYTRTPHWTIFSPGDWSSRLPALAALGFSSKRAQGIEEYKPAPSPTKGEILQPDEQLLCMDYLYFVGTVHGLDGFNQDYSPAWRFVAKHATWAPGLKAIADEILREHFGVPVGKDIPPFITVHVRHTDMLDWCSKDIAPKDCFAPASAYARRVEEVQEELVRKGVNGGNKVEHVLVTSDEPRGDEGKIRRARGDAGSELWEDVDALGWGAISEGLIERLGREEGKRYGPWFPTVLDSVLLSMGTGFVGSKESTMSTLAQRRVEEWNNGASRIVRWGSKGADEA